MLHEYFMYMSNDEIKRQCDCLSKLIKAIHLFSNISNEENDNVQFNLSNQLAKYEINSEDKFDVKLIKIPLIKYNLFLLIFFDFKCLF